MPPKKPQKKSPPSPKCPKVFKNPKTKAAQKADQATLREAIFNFSNDWKKTQFQIAASTTKQVLNPNGIPTVLPKADKDALKAGLDGIIKQLGQLGLLPKDPKGLPPLPPWKSGPPPNSDLMTKKIPSAFPDGDNISK